MLQGLRWPRRAGGPLPGPSKGSLQLLIFSWAQGEASEGAPGSTTEGHRQRGRALEGASTA